MRKLVQPAVTQSRALIDGTVARYRGSDEHPTIGLCARKLGPEPEDVPILTNWDDVRVALAKKNHRPAELWPRKRGEEPSGDELRSLRLNAGHTIEQAARLVFVSPARWEQYESGLQIPKAMHELYKLQTEQHLTHQIVSREKGVDPEPSRSSPGERERK